MTRRIFVALIFGLGGVAILAGLGVWQVQRLGWKQSVIADLEQRLGADPAWLPEAPTEARDEYLRVAVTGAYSQGELHVLTSARPWGPGFRVIAPFETAQGRRILVDRGYVPQTEKDAPRTLPAGPVTGALLWPNETDGFTPAPDPDANIWFARDTALMAAALGTEPVMLVAETPPPAAEWPAPQPVSVNLPNDHLEYAITWFSLCAIWAGMTVALVLRLRRKGEV